MWILAPSERMVYHLVAFSSVLAGVEKGQNYNNFTTQPDLV